MCVDHITWRIARTYLSGGVLEDTNFPGWDFTSPAAWTGAFLGDGGVAWFKLFDAATTAYGVHTGAGCVLEQGGRVLPADRPHGVRRAASRRSLQPPSERRAFLQLLCRRGGIGPRKHGQFRFLRDGQDVWAPFPVARGEAAVEFALYALDYNHAYDRGDLKGIDGAAVRSA